MELSTASIRNAKKAIGEYKKKIQSSLIINWAMDEIIRLANLRLTMLALEGYPEPILAQIKYGWQKTINGKKGLLENTHEKAVYIEFGTGIRGRSTPHTSAGEANYEYDVDSEHKINSDNPDVNRAWFFTLFPGEPMDIKYQNVIFSESRRTRLGGHQTVIMTQGNEASMFLLNAVLDFVDLYSGKESK